MSDTHTALIAVDWGSSALRGARLNAAGVVLEEAAFHLRLHHPWSALSSQACSAPRSERDMSTSTTALAHAGSASKAPAGNAHLAIDGALRRLKRAVGKAQPEALNRIGSPDAAPLQSTNSSTRKAITKAP